MVWVAKAGELYTKLTLRDSKFRQGLSKTLRRLRPLGQAMMRISRIARNMLIGGLGLGAMAVRSAMKFEQSMARIRAITNVTGKDFAKLTKIALKLGRTTVWTANQAAEAQEKLARAGFNTREIIETLPSVLNLATAAQMDLATAAQISSGVLRGMKLPTDQAARAMDVLAAAANSSNTNVAELGEAMKYIGPIGVQTGHSLEELVAILQVLADVQIRGSMGGTSLRRSISGLAGGSKPVIKLMKTFGVETAKANGKMRLFADMMDDLNARMADTTDMEKTAAIMQAFGQRAGPAMVELLARGGNAIREYHNRLLDLGGVSARMATVQLNTLQGAITRLRSAIEGFMIKTGSQFTKMVRTWVEDLTSLVQVLHELNEKEFKELMDWIKGFGKALAGLWIGTKVISTISLALIALVQIGAWAKIVIAAKAITVAIVAIGTAAVAAVAAVLVLAAGLLYAWGIEKKAELALFRLKMYSASINQLMSDLTAATESRRKAEEKGGKNYAAALEREIALRKRIIELEEREIDTKKDMDDAVREGTRLRIAKLRELNKEDEKKLEIAEKQAVLQAEARKAELENGLPTVRTGAPTGAAKDMANRFIGVAEMWQSLSSVGIKTEEKQLRVTEQIRDEDKRHHTKVEAFFEKAGGRPEDVGFEIQPTLNVVP